MMPLRFITLMLLATLSLSGCSHTDKITISLRSVSHLNPDIYHHSKPTRITIYQLREPLPFKMVGYDALIENPEKTLGSTLVDYNSFEIKPGTTIIKKLTLTPEVAYIGVSADYRVIHKSNWKCLTYLEPTYKHLKLYSILSLDKISCRLKETLL